MSKESAAAFAASVAHSAAVSAVLPAAGGLQLFRKVRDIENDTFRMYFTAYDSSLQTIHAPLEVAKFSMQCVSSSGRCVVRTFNNEKNGEDKPVLEVLVDNSLQMRVDASDIHGKIISDEWLGGGGFSSDDKYFVYVAGMRTID